MRAALALGAVLLLPDCAVGPDYQRPQMPLPKAWTTESPWRTGTPADGADRGHWWEIFADAQLDALEAAALAGNQSLAVAAGHYAQARALAQAAVAAYFPTVNAGAGAVRDRISANRPRASYALPNSSTVQNDFSAGLSVHYELDVFGGIRRQVESARATAEQAHADLANAQLLVSAELASASFCSTRSLSPTRIRCLSVR